MPEVEKNGRVQHYRMPTLNVMAYYPSGGLKYRSQHLPLAWQGELTF